MTDSEKMDLLLSEMQNMKADMRNTQKDIKDMQQNMKDMRQDMKDMQQNITSISLHLENVTDKNISILAENHGNLIDKLNQAIPAVDKNRVYEIKVNYLVEKVEKLEKEVDILKSRTA